MAGFISGIELVQGYQGLVIHEFSSSLIIDLVVNSRVLHCSLPNVFVSVPSQFSALFVQLYETDLLTETSNIP